MKSAFRIASAVVIVASVCFAPTSYSQDRLTLYFYPSPAPLSWSSPLRLTLSAALNTFLPSPFPLKHPIGHAALRLRCGSEEVLTGMSDQNSSDERNAVLHDGAGLGVLFQTFAGRLQGAQEIQQDLDARIPQGKVARMAFKIRPTTCARLMTYYKEYRDRGDWRSYGLPLRPRYGEGSGCSAFAISFLEVGGLLDPEYVRAWRQTIEVPRALIRDESHRVSLLSVLFSPRSWSWGAPGADSRKITFWNPDTVYSWIRAHAGGSSAELVFDRTSVPTPTEPIWLGNPAQKQ